MITTAEDKMEIQQFHIAGINYKKTDVTIRGKFALNETQYLSLLQKSTRQNIKNVFVLSTCNRTEIYGIASSARELSDLLCSETTGNLEVFEKLCYVKQGKDAVEHLFSVASGLDSQILGDYEIVGQLKNAIKFAKQNGSIGAFTERLSNTVFESSKAVKNKTLFSGGTVSVAFAAIQFLRLHCHYTASQKVAIIGTGKIGKNTCKNLIDYLGFTDITLLNRSDDKAEEFATELGIKFARYIYYKEEVKKADIIIVATNAPEPIISKDDLEEDSRKILIDLSIPGNIHTNTKSLPNKILVNVDDLSKMNDETLRMRECEIPKVKSIIKEYIDEFYDWYKMRKNAPIIRAAKKTLTNINLCPWFQSLQPETLNSEQQQAAAVQKAVKQLAVKLRNQEQTQTSGCTYIETLHDFIAHHPIKQ
ncbi:glutamyl-tRNA reductase [Arachidicoccus sp.]|uniref:glutamyl-tRNA reductase n=1 Tax=Arachidicoccus sp. TaxID=1872624 RepID=UPI003D209F83